MAKLFTFRIDKSNEAFIFVKRANENLNKETPQNPFINSFIRYVIYNNFAYLIFDIKTWYIFDIPAFIYTTIIKNQLKKSGYKGSIRLLNKYEFYKLFEGLLWGNKK